MNITKEMLIEVHELKPANLSGAMSATTQGEFEAGLLAYLEDHLRSGRGVLLGELTRALHKKTTKLYPAVGTGMQFFLYLAGQGLVVIEQRVTGEGHMIFPARAWYEQLLEVYDHNEHREDYLGRLSNGHFRVSFRKVHLVDGIAPHTEKFHAAIEKRETEVYKDVVRLAELRENGEVET